MVRWCWVVLCTTIEDYGCITSHAQSTAATYFLAAGKSDVIHLIVVCWALLFQSLGGEHIVHIRWLRKILFHACEDIKFIIFLSVHALSQQSMDSCHVLHQSKIFCYHAAYHGALVQRSWGSTVLGGPMYPPFKTLSVVHNVHRAQLPHVSSVRCNLT